MDDPASREWRLIREQARPGAMQMALDEVAAETAAAGGPRTVRVYRWKPGAVSLGYHQDPATLDWDYCTDAGLDAVRRQTGGGGIYHDTVGDISYSIALPASDLPGDTGESYRLLLEPVLEAFRWLSVPAALATEARDGAYDPSCYLQDVHPAHDVVVPAAEDTAGLARKISGNAQYRQRDAVLQHGSVTFSTRPERHLGVFTDPGLDADAFGARVTAIDEHSAAPRHVAVKAFERSLKQWADAVETTWTADELDRARALVDEKYGTDAWNRERSVER